VGVGGLGAGCASSLWGSVGGIVAAEAIQPHIFLPVESIMTHLPGASNGEAGLGAARVLESAPAFAVGQGINGQGINGQGSDGQGRDAACGPVVGVGGGNPSNTTRPVNPTVTDADLRFAQIDELIEAELARDHSVGRRAPELSVVVPVFNERNTIGQVLEAILRLPLPVQVVVVDDGSTDGTREVLQRYRQHPCVDVFLHANNMGKGAALQTGFFLAEAAIVAVQDADLEYDPADLLRVIEPIRHGEAEVVYGSRFMDSSRPVTSRVHRWGNQTLTWLSNRLNGQQLTDMETCHKAFRRELIEQMPIEQQRFGFEPEITARLARRGVKIREVPIGYRPRTWREGKKIGVGDLISAVWCMFRYRLWE